MGGFFCVFSGNIECYSSRKLELSYNIWYNEALFSLGFSSFSGVSSWPSSLKWVCCGQCTLPFFLSCCTDFSASTLNLASHLTHLLKLFGIRARLFLNLFSNIQATNGALNTIALSITHVRQVAQLGTDRPTRPTNQTSSPQNGDVFVFSPVSTWVSVKNKLKCQYDDTRFWRRRL